MRLHSFEWIMVLHVLPVISRPASGALGAAAGAVIGGPLSAVVGAFVAGSDDVLGLGGADALLDETREHWARLRAKLDREAAWPIGFIYGGNASPIDQHQVLAIGYGDRGDGTGRLTIWDKEKRGIAMAQDYRLKEIIAALDPITDWQPKGMRELARRVRWEPGWQGVGPLSYRSLKRTVGGNSLRQTLRAIDGNNPPRSLRQAYEQLGFPVGGGVTRVPNGPISLRKIARRIKAPDTVPLRFLSYNTYLLPGFQIPLGRWIDDTVGWDALSWFGIPFGGALLVTLGLASIPGVALATILEAAGYTPSKVIRTVTGIDLNSLASFGAKPALEERAQLLGPTLGVYDVCCLCEVFTQASRQEIFARLEQTSGGAPFAFTAGPDESGAWTLLGSGLLFLARSNRPIVKTERIIFANRGSRLKDSDAWANKGGLLNVIDLGFGQLELFQAWAIA